MALAISILFPVENLKYVPSEVRLITAGSWTLQAPVQAPGFADSAETEETREATLSRAVANNVLNSMVVVSLQLDFLRL